MGFYKLQDKRPETSRQPFHDVYSNISLASHLSKLGEVPTTTLLLKKAYSNILIHDNKHETPSLYLRLADIYQTINMPDEYNKYISLSIKTAREIKGRKTFYNQVDREYITFLHPGEDYVQELAENKQVNVIDEFINREGYPLNRINMYASAAEALSKINPKSSLHFMKEAIEYANTIADNNLKAQSFLRLSYTAVKLKDTIQVIQLLNTTLNTSRNITEQYISESREDNAALKTEQLSETALLFEATGNNEKLNIISHEAEQISRNITGDPSYYLPNVVKALARSGDFLLARKTADRANGDYKLNAFACLIQEAFRKKDTTVEKVIRKEENE